MKNSKVIIAALILVIMALGFVVYLFYFKNENIPISTVPPSSLVTYSNADYGFTFSLPDDWSGYSIVQNTWQGNPLTTTTKNESGPKLLIRNPKWTSAVPYEDIPIMIFTLKQWNSYNAGNFAISAAPINATEIARNNLYVFALPPRWDFDYSEGYVEAENILKTNPLKPFDVKKPELGKITYKNASVNDIVPELPSVGAVVGKEFKVTGKARGYWFFEASFPISVLDKNGETLTTSVAKAGGEWMTTDFVNFSADISIPENYTGPATLFLNKDNPSDMRSKDASISFPITIK